MAQPGGSRGPLRAALMALLIATAAVLAVGGAYAVVVTVPPLSDPGAELVAEQVAGQVVAQATGQATGQVAEPVAEQAAAPTRPRVVVLGDTFTAGAEGFAGNTWPELVCQRLGCDYVPLFATPRAGFTQPGADGRTLGQRLAEVVAAQPDVVVVAGGAWDLGVPEPVLRGAVNQLLYRLGRRLPDARTVVLSPFWPSAPAPYEVSLVRGTLDQAATKHGSAFLDVSDLFDVDHAGLVTYDGTAPTDAGQVYLADVVGPFLESALTP